jgi:hypothetical protein
VVLGIATCAVLGGGPVALAHADDNALRATLNSYAPKIVKDEKAVKAGLIGYPQGRVRPLTRALRHEVRDLHTLRFKLSTESPSTTNGGQAKSDIVKGLGLIAKAYSALRLDVLTAQGGPVPLSAVKAAVRTDRRGRTKLLAGLKLLA